VKTPSLQELKKELAEYSPQELLNLVLRLGRFKKENKELLSYLLFYAASEPEFVQEIKNEIDPEFAEVNISNLYQAKKTLRKILRSINKYCRYSTEKQTEIELRIYYCNKLRSLNIGFQRSQVLLNLYNGQVKKISNLVDSLHEDLQFDYRDSMPEFVK
jgi:hypothetical protein